jgi:hypothetical protein
VRKPIAWILCAISFLLFTTSAQAGEKRRGEGVIDQVNAGSRTITVQSEEYSVPLDCKIIRESGSITPLAQLRGIMNSGKGIVPASEVDFVRFEAVKKPGGWEMISVTLLDEAPE